MKSVFAIDPSINDIGIAFIDKQGDFLLSAHVTPDKAYRENTSQKISSLFEKISALLISHQEKVDEIVIEHSRFFARAKNQSHASAQKLNLVKGMLYGLCRSQMDVPVSLVWIPGFSKDEANLLARAGRLPEKTTQHERDAYWLAKTWKQTPEIMRSQFINNKDL